MTFRCAICGLPYLLWADGLHHDDRLMDHWHEPVIGDPSPVVDESLLPPEMRMVRP